MPADGERDPAPSLRASDSASAIDVDNVLAHEAPTRDLLEYYRSKVLAFAAEREQYLKRLETLERFASSSAAQPEGASRSTPEDALAQRALHDAALRLEEEREKSLRLQVTVDELTTELMVARRQRGAPQQPATAFMASGVAGGLPTAAAWWPSARAVAERAAAGTASSSASGGAGTDAASVPHSVPAPVGGPTLVGAAADTAPDAGAPPPPPASPVAPPAKWERWAAARDIEWRRLLTRGREQLDAWSAAAAAAGASAGTDVAGVRRKLHAVTRDYLLLRHTYNVAERAAAEELATMRATMLSAHDNAARSRAAAAECEAALAASKRNGAAAAAAALAAQSATHAHAAAAAESRHAAVVAELRGRVTALHAALDDAERRGADSEARRRREAEGFGRDVSALRTALRRLESQWALLGGLVADAAVSEAVAVQEEAAAAVAVMADERAASVAAALRRAGARASGGGGGSADGGARGDGYRGSGGGGRASAPPPARSSQRRRAHRVPAPTDDDSVGGPHAASAGGNDGDTASDDGDGGGDNDDDGDGGGAGGGPQRRPRHGHWAQLVYQPRSTPTPAASTARLSAAQRSRLRGKAALPADHPVLFRHVRSSGYGQRGRPAGVVNAHDVNARSRSASAGSRRRDGLAAHGGEAERDGGVGSTASNDVAAAATAAVRAAAIAARDGAWPAGVDSGDGEGERGEGRGEGGVAVLDGATGWVSGTRAPTARQPSGGVEGDGGGSAAALRGGTAAHLQRDIAALRARIAALDTELQSHVEGAGR